MMYSHDSAAPWDAGRWPDFTAKELACPCCGEFYYDPESFDAIQLVRTILGQPVNLNSAHRCQKHNAEVGGTPLSEHLIHIAFDIKTARKDRRRTLGACLTAGFTGYGYYNTFLHADKGRSRTWGTSWLKGRIKS